MNLSQAHLDSNYRRWYFNLELTNIVYYVVKSGKFRGEVTMTPMYHMFTLEAIKKSDVL